MDPPVAANRKRYRCRLNESPPRKIRKRLARCNRMRQRAFMATVGRGLVWLAILTIAQPLVVEASFLEETRRKALSGDVQAQETLSYLYREGRGVEKSRDEARRWSALAARSRAESARPRLGPSAPSSFSDTRSHPIPSPLSHAPARSPRRSEPTRPYGSPSSSLGYPVRRPMAATVATNPGRSLPTRPSGHFSSNASPGRYEPVARYERARALEARVRRTRKTRLGPVRLILSPVGYVLKRSKKAIAKAARRSAWEAARPY